MGHFKGGYSKKIKLILTKIILNYLIILGEQHLESC